MKHIGMSIINSYTIAVLFAFFATIGHTHAYSIEQQSGSPVILADDSIPANVSLVYIRQRPQSSIFEIRFASLSTSLDADSVIFVYQKNGTFPQSPHEGIRLISYYHGELQRTRPVFVSVESLSVGVYFISAFVLDTSGNYSIFDNSAADTCQYKPDWDIPENIVALVATAQKNRKIVLTWKKSISEDADMVRICYDTLFFLNLHQGNYIDINADDTTYLIGECLEKTTYYVNLFVKDTAENWSSRTNEACDTVITLDETPPNNAISLRASVLSPHSIQLFWDPKTVLSLDALSIEIWQNTQHFPSKNQMDMLVFSDSSLQDSICIQPGLKEFQEYYFAIFLLDSSGNYTQPPQEAMARATTWYKPKLFNREGNDFPLTVELLDTIRGIVSVGYRLLDRDGDFNRAYGQFKASNNVQWQTITHCQGDFGSVAASDSSILRTGIWNVKDQLTTSFDHDSCSVRIIAIDQQNLSDTVEMGKPSLFLDFKAPEPIYGLLISQKNVFSMELSWDSLVTEDAKRIVCLHGDRLAVSIADTLTMPWQELSPTATKLLITKLQSNRQYYFTFFVCDGIPNWSGGATVSDWTLNDRPRCVISPIKIEQSKDIPIVYRLSDTEGDEISCQYSYSLNGTTWNPATVSGDRASITSSHYLDSNNTVQWHTRKDIPKQYHPTLWFKITPSDGVMGYADSIQLAVDNYHSQSIVLSSPEGTQTGLIPMSYTVTDSSADSLFFSFFYSLDSGTDWTVTNHITVVSASPNAYTGHIVWDSDGDIGENSHEHVVFKITPSDNWEQGVSGTTERFAIDNTPSVTILTNPIVENDTVKWAFRIGARNYDSVTITQSVFFCDSIKKNINTLLPGRVIYKSNYDSTVVLWPSKMDFTANAPRVIIFLQYTMGSFIREVSSSPFLLHNNEIPRVKIAEIQSVQQGDIVLSATFSDIDHDTLNCDIEYLDPIEGRWKRASIENSNSPIDSSRYREFPIMWKSATDLPECAGETVLVKITPFDQDSGYADTVSVVVSNYGIPVCEAVLIPEKDTLSDHIRIIHAFKDLNQSMISFDVYYTLDSHWVKTENFFGSSKHISYPHYRDTFIWYSAIDFPDTLLSPLRLKIIPRDSTVGQSAQSSLFTLDNRSVLPKITGDFDSNGVVDIYDFRYAALYWSRSVKGITHPDSLQELAPANGIPPFTIVMPDSVFDHKDLQTFTHLCYWWFHNSMETNTFIASQKGMVIQNSNQGIRVVVSPENPDIAIHLKIRNIQNLTFCRYRLFYHQDQVSFKNIHVEKQWNMDHRATVTSLMIRDSTRCDIGITRIPEGRNAYSGSTTIATLHFSAKTRLGFSLDLAYDLLDTNRTVLESDQITLLIPKDTLSKVAKKRQYLTVFPNPSKSNAQTPLLTLVTNETQKQWGTSDQSGFMFNVPMDDIVYNNRLSLSLQVFDVLGNVITMTPEIDCIFSFQGAPPPPVLGLYWNGCTMGKRKLGSGAYVAVIHCLTDINKWSFYVTLGVE